MRFEITLAMFLIREASYRERMDVPVVIQWLHGELTHGSENQECIFDKQFMVCQWPGAKVAISRSCIYASSVQMLMVDNTEIHVFSSPWKSSLKSCSSARCGGISCAMAALG